MASNKSAATSQQTASLSNVKACAAEIPPADPGSPLEVVTQGPGTVNDPPVTDTRPPGACDGSEFSAYV